MIDYSLFLMYLHISMFSTKIKYIVHGVERVHLPILQGLDTHFQSKRMLFIVCVLSIFHCFTPICFLIS